MGIVGGACLPSNAYYPHPRTPDYILYFGVHVCWSEHSDLPFVYGFMSLNYGLGTMTVTTFSNVLKTAGWNLQCMIKVENPLSYNQNFIPRELSAIVPEPSVKAIIYSRSTKFVQMMILGWPLTFLQHGRIPVVFAVAILGECCIYADIQWLFYPGERIVAHGSSFLLLFWTYLSNH